jgi:mono/diheme cytochrome c family protein
MKRVKKVLKWSGIVLGVFVLILAGGVFTIVMVSKSRANERYPTRESALAIPSDATVLEEGRRLFYARGCAECHSEDAGGKVMSDDNAIGTLASANLTLLRDGWSGADWSRAVRRGVAPDGRPYYMMPSHDYQPMSDAELGSIVAYVATLPRIERELPPASLGPVGSALLVFDAMPMLPAERIDHAAVRGTPPQPGTPQFGAYLGASCTGCHGDQMSGGEIPGAPPEMGNPPNLTPHATGLASWTPEQFTRLMREGKRPDGSSVNPTQMPWGVYRYMSDQELADLWGHLQSLRPVAEGNR